MVGACEEVWEARHRKFHRALVSACNSPCLLHLHELLCDQFDRYRRLSANSRLPNVPRWLIHKEILDAALAGKADKLRAVDCNGPVVVRADSKRLPGSGSST
jgi:DNA-binding GntR family transcriptional regulator